MGHSTQRRLEHDLGVVAHLLNELCGQRIDELPHVAFGGKDEPLKATGTASSLNMTVAVAGFAGSVGRVACSSVLSALVAGSGDAASGCATMS